MPKRARTVTNKKKIRKGGTYTHVVLNPWMYSGVRQPDMWRMTPTETHKFKTYQLVQSETTYGQLLVHISPATFAHLKEAATWTSATQPATWTSHNVDNYTYFHDDLIAHYRVVGCSAKIYDIGETDTVQGTIYPYVLQPGYCITDLEAVSGTEIAKHALVARSYPIEKGKEYYVTSVPCAPNAQKYFESSHHVAIYPPSNEANGNGWLQMGFLIQNQQTGEDNERSFMVETTLNVEYTIQSYGFQFERKKRGEVPLRFYTIQELERANALLSAAPNVCLVSENENQMEHNVTQQANYEDLMSK